MNFGMTDDQTAIRDAVSRICAQFDAEYWLRRDREGGFPTDFYDPIYQIDRNPNPVMGRTIQLSLPLDPNLAATASCVSMGIL